MAFTWASTALSSTASTGYDRARVRSMTGDKSTGRPVFLTDEEVDYYVGANATIQGAARDAVDALLAEWSGEATSKRVGDLQLARNEIGRLEKLRGRLDRAVSGGAKPVVSGVTVSGKQAREDLTDRVTPAFTRGMHDIPGSYRPGSGQGRSS